MRRIAEQTLDSSHLVEAREGLSECICCGVRYPGTGTHCHRCQAPMQLSRTVKQGKLVPRFISMVGASGAGKTVYLGLLLDFLSKAQGDLRGTANGPFSVAVQENTVSALNARRFPEKTPSEADEWQWVHCKIESGRKKKKAWELVTPDFAGEAISYEVEHPGTFPAIQSVIDQSGGMLLLCDAIAACDSPLTEDIFALKLATYVHASLEKRARRSKRSKADFPLAVVFTKCDQRPEVRDDPAKFAANNLPRFEQFCRRAFQTYGFFAASAVANCATVMDDYGCCRQVALHVEPRGVMEPLEWILENSH